MIYYNNTHKSKTIMGADEDPSTSNPTSAGHTTPHDHHLIDKPVDHHPVDMHYCMLPQQQQLLQNTSGINDQPKYIAPNWPDHQFQGGQNMVANRPIAANSPNNHQFTRGGNNGNYGNQYHTTMIDTSKLYPNDEYQGICTNVTYMLPQQYNCMLPQQQQQPQQQQLLQNASWINDQHNYMAPNRPDRKFPGGNIVVANSLDLPDNHQFTGGVDSSNYENIDNSRLYPNDEYQGNCMLPQQQQQPQQQQLQNASWINDQPNYMVPNRPDHKFPEGNIVVANSLDMPDNHQFTGGVDSSNYENIDTSRLYPNDEYQGSCTDISDDLFPDYDPMDDDLLNDYLADVQTNGQLLTFSSP
jgi:hypothetical protein